MIPQETRKEGNYAIQFFRGQITDAVIYKQASREQHIIRPSTSKHDKHISTIRSNCKWLSKVFYETYKFTEWCSAEIGTILDEGIPLDDFEIKLKLSVLKPLHASWLVELFNYMTSDKGRQVVENRRLLALLKHLRKVLMVSNHWIPSLLLIH